MLVRGFESHPRRSLSPPASANVIVVIDEGTEFGARVARRLREELVVWLTTVTPAGAPLPRPVGFLWDGGELVSMYSQPGARVRNIAANPRVTLNFDGDGSGGDIVVLSGIAQADPDAPAADAVPAWLEKYAAQMDRAGMTPASFAGRYSVPVRIRLTRVDGR
jgi:PPOX class probable F420-dependent enzyme